MSLTTITDTLGSSRKLRERNVGFVGIFSLKLFTKILPVKAALILEDGRTHLTKLIGALRDLHELANKS